MRAGLHHRRGRRGEQDTGDMVIAAEHVDAQRASTAPRSGTLVCHAREQLDALGIRRCPSTGMPLVPFP